MLKDTLNPVNFLNPIKKIKKIDKWLDAVGKIKISIQKQNKHIQWTKEYIQSLTKWESKSTWKNPEEADRLTREAFEKWTSFKGQANKKIYETNK